MLHLFRNPRRSNHPARPSPCVQQNLGIISKGMIRIERFAGHSILPRVVRNRFLKADARRACTFASSVAVTITASLHAVQKPEVRWVWVVTFHRQLN